MPRARVVVNRQDGSSYDVHIGDNLLAGLGEKVREQVPAPGQVALISDTNVAPLYGKTVKDSLAAAGLAVTEITIPAGEASKSIDVVSEIWQALATKKFDRYACVVALGGGVVGDLAGFVAATYARGIAFVQVPTSLLAMVDASVGGKTGINLAQGKNLVGAFLQPSYVCADIATLDTLPEREWKCGFGEIAKSAALDGDDFFFWLLESAPSLQAHDMTAVHEAIARCAVFKANVVAADETERAGVRECLNYGHTLGHAIETLAGYGTYSHGEAVAEGMRFVARLAVAEYGASMDFLEAQDDVLDALGVAALDFSAEPDSMLEAMRLDKKTKDGQVRFVLVRDPGNWEVVAPAQDVLLEHLGAWARSK